MPHFPQWVTATSFPAVLAGFCDYVALAMITPALPHYLEDFFATADPEASRNSVDSEVAQWTGRITAVQYVAITLCNVFRALYGDRIPSKAALQCTVLASTACFAWSAFTTRPWQLLLVRAAAGLSSPLASAIVHILDRARSREESDH